MEQIGQGLLEVVRLLQAGDREVWSLAGPRLRSPTSQLAFWAAYENGKLLQHPSIRLHTSLCVSVQTVQWQITLWKSEPAVAMLTAHWIGRESSRVHSGMEWKIEVVGCSL